jgi:hypothetical protein
MELPNIQLLPCGGAEWPELLGDFQLMGPVNKLGTRRWYEKHNVFNGYKYTKRVKVNSSLVPLWETYKSERVILMKD